MPVPPETYIGPYQVRDCLGAGGMGEVYRAWDARLQRFVAIKVLLAHHAQDPDLPARLEREALILASLNHPGIATVYGIERWQGNAAIVMELVEGETLADRCRRGPLPLAEVIHIARGVAAALSFAHERGVVHRDLKPANIRIRPDGAVKVLDFGLAKATEASADAGGGETRTGARLGTVRYMSPEQLRGYAFDRRTDVWAFGCTLFEMLGGRPPFARATEVDTITAILHDEPDWRALPPETPGPIKALLEHCLQKNPSLRLRELGDARFEASGPPHVPSGTGGSGITMPPAPRTTRALLWVAAALGVTAVAVLLVGWWRQSSRGGALAKFEVMVDGLGQMPGTYVGESGPGAGVSISPDGRRIVYPREGRLWVRELSRLDSRPLDGTDGAVAPTWSPDGASLAFAVGSQVKRLPDTTGTPVTVVTAPGAFVEAGALAWGADGTITFTTGNGPVFQVPAQGGDARLVLTQETGERDFHDLARLPDGRGTLFVTHLTSGQYAVDALLGGTRRRLLGPLAQVVRHAIYSTTGHLLYQRVDRNPGVWAVAVDPATLVATGDPFLVAAGGLRPSLATDGTLVFVTDEQWGLQRLSIVDRTGAVVRDIGQPVRGLRQPALSSDDARVAVVVQGTQHDDVWVYDVTTGQATQLTFDGSRGDPAWDPTGPRLVHSCGVTSSEGGTCLVDAAGAGDTAVVAPRASMASFAPDGRRLVHVLLDPASRTDIWLTLLGAQAPPKLLVRTDSFEYHPRVSPDGRYLAFATSATGRPDVFVTAFPEPRSRWRVSPESGAEPRWNPAGGELFYVDAAGRLQSVTFEQGASMPPPAPVALFAEMASSLRLTDGYSPSSSGSWFVTVRDAGRTNARPRITVVQNWFEEFRGGR
ncbi:MAG: protein kinase [Vicinamibacterales bacterium]